MSSTRWAAVKQNKCPAHWCRGTPPYPFHQVDQAWPCAIVCPGIVLGTQHVEHMESHFNMPAVFYTWKLLEQRGKALN